MNRYELILLTEMAAMCWSLNMMREAGIAQHKLSVFTNRILQIESSLKYIGGQNEILRIKKD